ncbi:MAG: ABC transporter ATP-binding protein [Candidatus Rokubacteria bacterium]|nr:ABC transporter ATP-binding protein [Candidatus Rokubacteria bacterium]
MSGPPTRSTERLRLEAISKRFGATIALAEAGFEVRAGEIHALLGENGAGKTTLMNVLSGLYHADAGRIWLDGRPAEIAEPRDAIRHRIGMVHQHFELIPPLTALENVIIGQEGSTLLLRRERQARGVAALAARFGFEVDLRAPVAALGLADQQKVEILKAIFRGVDILILDEPTTVLTPQEADALLRTLRTMASEGLSVVFISHKIHEVLGHCDRATVMRAGRSVGTVDASATTEQALVEMMIGERVARTAAPAEREVDDTVLLRVDDVTVAGRGGLPAVSHARFSIGRGEVVGLAGVDGNGQRELVEAIVGLRRVTGGRVELGGRNVTTTAVGDRLAQGLAYIPEDRLGDGALPSMSVAENLFLGVHRLARGGGLTYRPAAIRAGAAAPVRDYAIRGTATTPLGMLSGGNIQKVLIARALAVAGHGDTPLVVAHNPTRGLDVRTTEFVRRCLVDVSRRRGGVFLVSSDLDELMQLAHRILVLFRGAIVADLPSTAFDAYEIGRLMTGAAARA